MTISYKQKKRIIYVRQLSANFTQRPNKQNLIKVKRRKDKKEKEKKF